MEIKIPSSMVILETGTFDNTGLTDVTIPGNITKCGPAFRDCINLRKAVFSEGTRSIWGGTFKGCTALELVIIPSSVKRIARDTFKSCQNLKDVWIYSDNIKLDTVSEASKQDDPLFSSSPNLTIHAHRGSSSHVYASLHHINFAEIPKVQSEEVKPEFVRVLMKDRIYSDKELRVMLTPVPYDDTDHYWGQFQYALGYSMNDLAYQCLEAYKKFGNKYDKIFAQAAEKFLDQAEGLGYTSGVAVGFFTDNDDNFSEHPTLRACDIIVEFDSKKVRNSDDIYEFSMRSIKNVHTFTILRSDENGRLQKLTAEVHKEDPLIGYRDITPLTFEEL